VSYFDITPDLKFILGKDDHVANLFHVLGAGIARQSERAGRHEQTIGERLAATRLASPRRDRA
jgi:hypothetical protein